MPRPAAGRSRVGRRVRCGVATAAAAAPRRRRVAAASSAGQRRRRRRALAHGDRGGGGVGAGRPRASSPSLAVLGVLASPRRRRVRALLRGLVALGDLVDLGGGVDSGGRLARRPSSSTRSGTTPRPWARPRGRRRPRRTWPRSVRRAGGSAAAAARALLRGLDRRGLLGGRGGRGWRRRPACAPAPGGSAAGAAARRRWPRRSPSAHRRARGRGRLGQGVGRAPARRAARRGRRPRAGCAGSAARPRRADRLGVGGRSDVDTMGSLGQSGAAAARAVAGQRLDEAVASAGVPCASRVTSSGSGRSGNGAQRGVDLVGAHGDVAFGLEVAQGGADGRAGRGTAKAGTARGCRRATVSPLRRRSTTRRSAAQVAVTASASPRCLRPGSRGPRPRPCSQREARASPSPTSTACADGQPVGEGAVEAVDDRGRAARARRTSSSAYSACDA